MPAPTGAYVMRNALVTIDATEYANQCTTARLDPEADTQTLRTLVPDGIVQDVDSAAWTLTLAGIQDYTAATGLARYMTDNHGQQVTLTLEPKAGGVSATVEVICKAAPFGGEQGQWTTIEIELPCVGAPLFTDPI